MSNLQALAIVVAILSLDPSRNGWVASVYGFGALLILAVELRAERRRTEEWAP